MKRVYHCSQCGNTGEAKKKPKTIEKWLCFFGFFPVLFLPLWLIFWLPFAVWCLFKRHRPVCANCGWGHPVPISLLTRKLEIN